MLFHARILNRTLLQPNVQPQTRRPPQRRRSDVVMVLITAYIKPLDRCHPIKRFCHFIIKSITVKVC